MNCKINRRDTCDNFHIKINMSKNIDEWEKIWNKKMANEELLHKDFETVFMELKRLTGNDTTGKGVEFQGFMKQYADIKTNISTTLNK